MRLLVRDGLFTDGDPPALLGTRCAVCGSVHFPRADACTYCATEEPEPIALSRRGTLWAWTAVTAPPPGYQGEVPFGIGVVERVPPLKEFFMAEARGESGALPKLLSGQAI